eukprot:10790871-Ditylum_brightwellii.AAC.1
MKNTQQEDIVFGAEYYDKQMIVEEEIAQQMMDPIKFAASRDPDILYYHEAMKHHDCMEFIKAIITEVNGHVDGEHWELVKRSEVLKGTKILDSIWALRRKEDIKTGKITKYKARLNIHGG